jgi:dTMP kinase
VKSRTTRSPRSTRSPGPQRTHSSHPRQPLFFTFEGTEGAGKSTVIRQVRDWLANDPALKDREIVVTREPGGVPVAEAIREVLLRQEMDSWTELFLYEAARAEHLVKVVNPALHRGAIVLCDRFTDSTLAYQGSARGLPWNQIRLLNALATQGVSPSRTFWLDLPVEVGLARVREITRFEREGVAFQKKVRSGFAKAAREEPSRWLKLNAERHPAEWIAARIYEEIRSVFDARSAKNGRTKRSKSR